MTLPRSNLGAAAGLGSATQKLKTSAMTNEREVKSPKHCQKEQEHSRARSPQEISSLPPRQRWRECGILTVPRRAGSGLNLNARQVQVRRVTVQGSQPQRTAARGLGTDSYRSQGHRRPSSALGGHADQLTEDDESAGTDWCSPSIAVA